MARASQFLVRNPAALLGVIVAAVLVAVAARYGYHRDELYFLEAGQHLAWGYPDQGPLTPAIARLMDLIAPGSLTALRLPSALATGAIVLLTGLLTRELGGGRRAETIAAGSAAVAAGFLTIGHLLSTATFDLLAWTLLTWLVVRAVRRHEDRLWPVAGAVLGLALLNKPLPAFLAAALLASVALVGPRRLLRSPWVWTGVAVAALLWLPWLLWQAGNGWPQLEVSGNISAGGSASSEPRWALLPFQFLLVSPVLAPIWIAGLVRLFRDPEVRDVRFLAWTWALLAALFLVTGGKPYYLAGLLPALIAAGATPTERWLDRSRSGARRAALGVAFAGSALVGAVVALPLLPAERLEPVLAVNEDVGATVGWPSFVRTVARVRDELPDGERAVVFTANYGQAGAIDRYGADFGLPPAYSGHNGYWRWRVPARGAAPIIVVGMVEAPFRDCDLAARNAVPGGLDTEEDGTPIWTCAAPRAPWPELWPSLERLG